MIKIQHRVNSLKKLKNIDHNFGVEVDVRSINKKLILNHEPFQKAVSLDTFLKKFNHKFLILNVKEEGIENLILNYVKKNRIKNYFLLDVTVPKIFQFIKNKKKNNLCLRISKFEKLNQLNFFNKKIEWIWVDTFDNKIPLNINDLEGYSKKFKLCLVSPELVKTNNIDVTKFIKINKYKLNFFSAVCSKNIKTWEKYGY
tara:strand:+ start:3410 stop:4009 length:600 start_codon:yes stop_codon:yes gene_type:complete